MWGEPSARTYCRPIAPGTHRWSTDGDLHTVLTCPTKVLARARAASALLDVFFHGAKAGPLRLTPPLQNGVGAHETEHGERYEQDARCDSEDRLREACDSLRVDYAEEDGLQGGDQDGLKELRE